MNQIRISQCLKVGFIALFLVGCGDTPKSYTIDINGYSCSSCNAKFYTVGAVNAQQCPQCKSGGVQSVVSYVCPTDKEITVSTRSRTGGACKKCGLQIEAGKLPTESELTAWGAAKKSKNEVGGR